MDLFLLTTGLGVESFNVPVIVAMVAAPILLILGIVWLALAMRNTKTQK